MKKKQALLDNNNSSFVYKKIRQNRLKNRLKGGWLVFALSTLSMVSIGFSTWVIVGTVETPIIIDADDVIQEQIISIGDITYDFAIGPDGLVSDYEIKDTGTFSIPFTIDNTKAEAYISSTNTMKATITLSETSSTTFLSYVNKLPTSDDTTSISTNSSSAATSITNSIVFDVSSTNETTVTITYCVEKLDSDTAKSFYGEDKMPSFAFSVVLEGVL